MARGSMIPDWVGNVSKRIALRFLVAVSPSEPGVGGQKPSLRMRPMAWERSCRRIRYARHTFAWGTGTLMVALRAALLFAIAWKTQ
jgi:hypothetical protein